MAQDVFPVPRVQHDTQHEDVQRFQQVTLLRSAHSEGEGDDGDGDPRNAPFGREHEIAVTSPIPRRFREGQGQIHSGGRRSGNSAD